MVELSRLRESEDSNALGSPCGDNSSTKWLALALISLGLVATSIDGTIVVVALPSIKTDLGFSDASLVAVVNIYLASFGGFLLLTGRLGDHLGSRKVFLIATAVFTLASLGCALASTRPMLLGLRFVQGAAGAAVATTTLALFVNLSQSTSERARAMGIYSFISSGGGIAGLLSGGLLTNVLGWRWIFLLNVPIGVAAYIAALLFLPRLKDRSTQGSIDVAGAVTMTASMLAVILAMQSVSVRGWTAGMTLLEFGAAIGLLTAFLRIETASKTPLIPLSFFRMHNFVTCSIANVLSSAVGAASIFVALYVQLVLKYTSWEVGLAFIPSDFVMAVFSLGLSARCVRSFGLRWPLVLGLLISSFGLLFLSQARMQGTLIADVIPGMALVGLGIGISCSPMLTAAMHDVSPTDTGLASGVFSSCSMMGCAIGAAIFAAISSSVSDWRRAAGVSQIAALNEGYHVIFLVAAAVNASAVLFVLKLRISCKSERGNALVRL